jgi:outer membrane receptor protein involved in Fe transport
MDVTALFEFDAGRGEYVARPESGHTTEYERDIHSIYGIYAGERGRFGFQAGVRGEYTDRLVMVRGSGERFVIDRWDWFPSAHASWRIGGGRQLMGSYARRIERPRSWYLEPFETWTDAFNVRQGNPGLDPEKIDSWEFGFQTDLGPNFFSAEAYYRVTRDKIERVRSARSETVTLHTLENVGTDRSLGVELSLNLELFPWWDLRLSGSLYDFRVEGELFGESFDRRSFNWNGRIHHELRIGGGTRAQLVNIYNSPTVWSQGRFEGFFTTNLTVRRDLLGRAMTASVQISDLFDTARHESTSSGREFSSFNAFDRRAPQVVLTLSYNFDGYGPGRRRERAREDGEDEDEF